MDFNIDLKNLNVQDLKAKILQFSDKKTLIKIGISAGAIILFLIIYYAILNPIVNKKKLQLDKMNEMKQETSKFISDIKSKQNMIKKIEFFDFGYILITYHLSYNPINLNMRVFIFT